MVVIALDIGGTKIKSALVDKDLKIIKSLKVPTFASKGKKHILETISLVIESLIDTRTRSSKATGAQKSKIFRGKITGIGVSFPGFANDKGKILFAGNALSSFDGFNLKSYLEKKFFLPVVIENDANCFTLAESYYGAGRNDNIILGITWGSGIGSGLVIKNQHTIHNIFGKERTHDLLYRGSFDGAMELGHTPLFMEKGKVKTLEQLVGGAYLVKKHKVHDITELYNTDKKAIKEVFKRFAQGLAIAINLTNPDTVIIGGGVSKLPASAFKEILVFTKKYALPTHTKNLKIRKFGISDDAGLLGIAIIALKKKI